MYDSYPNLAADDESAAARAAAAATNEATNEAIAKHDAKRKILGMNLTHSGVTCDEMFNWV